jgi:hypothetical protein
MKTLQALKAGLAGYKTYLIAAAAVIGVAISWAEGNTETAEAVKLITAALLAMTVRAGIAKAQ